MTDRIQVNSRVMLGKPVIRGTRLTVELIVRKIAEGAGDAEVLEAYPQLTREDIRAALHYAADTPAQQPTLELTVDEAAEHLNVSRPYLVGLLETGQLPHHKVGTHPRVRLADLIAFKRLCDAESEIALRELAAISQEKDLGACGCWPLPDSA